MTTNTRSMDERLLPCPFCGSAAQDTVYLITKSGPHIYCDNCGTHGPIVVSEDTAIAVWNRRTQSEGAVRTEGAGDGRYRKKPVTIDAYLYRGGPLMKDAPDWVAEASEPDGIITNTGFVTKRLQIKTLEGKMFASPGDWIIRGVKGEVYPCKPDIFAATYEPASLPQHAQSGVVESELPHWEILAQECERSGMAHAARDLRNLRDKASTIRVSWLMPALAAMSRLRPTQTEKDNG